MPVVLPHQCKRKWRPTQPKWPVTADYWPPHSAAICHRGAHIETSECGAPGFFTHGAKLLLAFVTAGDERMARQSQRRAVERWLTEEGGMGLASTHGDQLIMQRRAKQPTMRVIRVGGLHYFAPVDPTPGSAGSNSGGGGSSGGGGDMPGSSADADAAPAAAKFSAATRVELVHHALMSPTTQVSRHGRGGYG